MNHLPLNLTPWLVSSIILFIFSVRFLINYSRVRSTLSKYFAIVCISASLATGLWTFPFIFLNLADNMRLIRFLLLLGDLFLYVALIYQVRIMWYLLFRNRFRFISLSIASLSLSAFGYYSGVMSTLGSVTYPALIDGSMHFATSVGGDLAQSALLLAVITNGGYFLIKTYSESDRTARFGSLSIGALHMVIGLGGLFNILFRTDTGSNMSPIVLAVYAVGFGLFFASFLLFRISKSKRK